MRTAWEASSGTASLAGTRIAIQGAAGKVGGGVARLVAAEGARVMASDIGGGRVAALAAEIGGQVVAPDRILATECDVFSPCAMGGILTAESSVPQLRCQLVCGAANNQLENDEVSVLLQSRGIDYVPDFVANAGGIIAIAEERNGFDPDRANALADGIGIVVRAIIDEARVSGESALVVARRRAARRIAAQVPQ